MVEHPTSSELRALAEGKVTPERAVQLVAHLTGCSRCQTATFPAPGPPTVPDTEPARGGPEVSLSDPSVTDEAPGRYQIIRELGRGGQALVYVAFDHHLGREVAMKIPLVAPANLGQTVLRFLREARITARLEHPNIVPIHEIGRRADGTYYCTQRLIRPAQDAAAVRTLRTALSAARSSADRLALVPNFLAVCNALAHAHSRGVIHRDLKPDNIVIGSLGETVVLDWGLGRIKGEPSEPGNAVPQSSADGVVSLVGQVMGTPSYMSPEQARGAHGDVDERSDAWSLGAILYEILTGYPPFLGADAAEVVGRVLTHPVQPVTSQNPEAPPPLAAVAMRALERDPKRRYPSAEALGKEISAWLAGLPVEAYRYSPIEQVRLAINRHKSATAVALVALALLTFASALLVRKYLDASSAVAEAMVAHARAAEENLEWDRAAAYFASARVEDERLDARYGSMLTANRAALVIRKLSGHTGSVYALAHSADLRTLASASFDRTVRLWDLATSQTRRVLKGHKGLVAGVAFSPDGRWVATASEDHTARLWDLSTGGPSEIVATSTDGFTSAAFSPDSQRVAFGGEDKKVWLVSMADRSIATTPAPDGGAGNHTGPIYSVAFSPDGELLATASRDSTVRLWSADGGFELRHTLRDHRDSVLSVRFSPDGKSMATGSRDGLVMLYEAHDLQRHSPLAGHEQKVYSVAFSPDGQLLATAGTDRSVRLWLASPFMSDVGGPNWRGLVGASYRRDREVNAVTFLDDAQIAWAGSGGDVFIRRLGPQKIPADPVISLAVLPRAGLVVHPDKLGYALRPINDFETARVHALPPEVQTHGLHAVSVSPDEKLLLGSCKSDCVCWVDLETHALLSRNQLTPGLIIRATAFSPTAPRAAVVLDSSPVVIFDTSTRTILEQLPHEITAFTAAFSPDGKLLATGSYDKVIRLWDTTSWQLVGTLQGHEHGIRVVAFSPDGTLLASGSWDREVRLWDVKGLTAVAVLRGHQEQVLAVAFSPDGKVLASGGYDGTVRLWSVDSRLELARFVSDEGRIWSLAWSPDGRKLFYGGLQIHALALDPLEAPEVARRKALEAGGFRLDGMKLVR